MRALSTSLEAIRCGRRGGADLTRLEVENELSYQRYRAAEQIIRLRVGEDDQRCQDEVDLLVDRLSEADDPRAMAEQFLQIASLSDADLLVALEAAVLEAGASDRAPFKSRVA